MDLKKFIVPTVLENTDEDQRYGDRKFKTEDLIYLPSYEETKVLTSDQRISYPTDYAVMNGAMMSSVDFGSENRKSCWSWLRSASSSNRVNEVSLDGIFDSSSVSETDGSFCPALQLNLSSIISARSASPKYFKITEHEYKDGKKYHTIEFGKFPKTYVGHELNSVLEMQYSFHRLKPTGEKYTGSFVDGELTYNEEYSYVNGENYVRVVNERCDDDSEFSDGTKSPKSGTALWAKVEPITWVIENWEDLPKELNPSGKGIATTIKVHTEEAVMSGIPFYPNGDDQNRSMWQNSTIRGYLNGINVNNITNNGNTKYTALNGGDFRESSFLSEALSIELSWSLDKIEEVKKHVEKKKERKGYGVKVLDVPMGVKDQIKFYIDNGKSFMLHGPSGVGKTRRIEEADPDFVSIVLRNGILPEEVIGKTIYPNNDKTKAGTWVPPAWYAQLCQKCEQQPDKNHVLFIDEITNVKPSEQSLVFHLVLNNSIGPNIGKLPDNVVVAAAGNSKEESEAAYNMPEPLFRRFDGHIELKPDVQLWLEWGSEKSNKDPDRLKVHPVVSSFVGSYGSQVFYSPYDSEDPPKYAIDPRGWEQVSDIIYDNEGVIARELIENKVGKEIAASFIAFAQTPPLMVEDIIDKNYDYSDIPSAFDAKYALALSLRSADIEEIAQIREFINDELGSEILSMFDVIWAGDDNEKAIHLASLPKLKENNQSSIFSDDTDNYYRDLPF